MNQRESRYHSFLWEQLELWAGVKCVERGRGYLGHVHDISYGEGDELFSTVVGTTTYYTHVWLDGDGELVSECTCPVGSRCKHAVASILVFVRDVKAGMLFPILSSDDPRPTKIAEAVAEKLEHETRIHAASKPSVASANSKTLLRPKPRPRDLVEEYIAALGYRAREAVLLDLVADHPEVRADLQFRVDTRNTNDGRVREIATETRKELLDISLPWVAVERASRRLYEAFSQLIDRGYEEWILEDGVTLLQEAKKECEERFDGDDFEAELEFTYLFVPILNLVSYALEKSARTRVEKLLWDVQFQLKTRDFYSSIRSLWDEPKKTTPAEWWAVANAIQELMPRYDECAREQLKHYRECALGRAGSRKIIIQALMETVETGRDYDKLVTELLKAHRTTEAEEWCRHALYVLPKEADYRDSLRDKLEKMAASKEALVTLAVVATERFVETCDKALLEPMIQACTRAGVWDDVRPQLCEYLKSGKFPRLSHFVLPLTGPVHIRVPSREFPYRTFPFYDILVSIALHEKDACEAIRVYDQANQDGYSFPFSCAANKIPFLVLEEFPEDAFRIWKLEIWDHPNLSESRKDDSAEVFLPRLRQAFVKQGRLDAWHTLSVGVRKANSKDRSLAFHLQKLDDREEWLRKKLSEE